MLKALKNAPVADTAEGMFVAKKLSQLLGARQDNKEVSFDEKLVMDGGSLYSKSVDGGIFGDASLLSDWKDENFDIFGGEVMDYFHISAGPYGISLDGGYAGCDDKVYAKLDEVFSLYGYHTSDYVSDDGCVNYMALRENVSLEDFRAMVSLLVDFYSCYSYVVTVCPIENWDFDRLEFLLESVVNMGLDEAMNVFVLVDMPCVRKFYAYHEKHSVPKEELVALADVVNRSFKRGILPTYAESALLLAGGLYMESFVDTYAGCESLIDCEYMNGIIPLRFVGGMKELQEYMKALAEKYPFMEEDV